MATPAQIVTLFKGVPANALTLNHTPILLNGQSINLSKGILT